MDFLVYAIVDHAVVDGDASVDDVVELVAPLAEDRTPDKLD